MYEWINRVLAIARSRGFTIDWARQYSEWDPFAVTFTFTCPDGNHGYAAAGSLMIGATTPEQFTAYWGTCNRVAPAPIGSMEYRPLGSLQNNESRPGWFIPWRSGKAAHNALEALFS